MKNLTLIIFLAIHYSLFTLHSFSQPCLPEGITFSTQAEIDNFQTNYPNCTEIEGDVEIYGFGSNISNLNGLSVLTSFGGDLNIIYTSLSNLAALENLTSIGGGLSIGSNAELTGLLGLQNLTYIGEGLYLYDNISLTDLSGLDNLVSIGELLKFEYNNSLASFTGLDNLTSIGGNIEVWDNEALINLTGLENVTSIGGNISIRYNEALSSLTGLDNIDAGSINNIEISVNPSLSTCDVQSLGDYLASPNGVVDIFYNAIGCNNPWEIANACGIILSCLPYGNYHFTKQSDIDNFGIFCDCTELEEEVEINGYGGNISNLNGLSILTSFGSDLRIVQTSLTNLSGLDNVTTFGGDIEIYLNDSLESLTGLGGLTSVEGSINIGFWTLWVFWQGNPLLNDLSGLDNLTSIEGDFIIGGNDVLTSFTGMDNLSSIGGYIGIYENPDLTSLTGLEGLTAIGGSLEIGGNSTLTSLTGLEGLAAIGGNLRINDNDTLTSLSGLDNLTSIDGDFIIGEEYEDSGNSSLTSLAELDNLTSIGGDFRISHNETLTSLTGLDNIQAETISNLFITNNSSLSTCEVLSICSYLASPNGTIEINDNAPGCNNPEEVDSLCNIVSINEVKFRDKPSISPNPLISNAVITYTLKESSHITLEILDLSGQLVVTLVDGFQQQGEQEVLFNSSSLPAGIYFCVLKTNPAHAGQTIKLIKQ